MTPLCVDRKTAAAALGISLWSLDQYIAEGLLPIVQLPSTKHGDEPSRRVLIDVGDLQDFVQKHKGRTMSTYRTPRCIAIPGTGPRCLRRAAKRSGDCYLCSRHSTLWTLLLVDDRYSPQTRHMLAFARWSTIAEGQALIDGVRSRRGTTT